MAILYLDLALNGREHLTWDWHLHLFLSTLQIRPFAQRLFPPPILVGVNLGLYSGRSDQ